jgi:hypothetical protein
MRIARIKIAKPDILGLLEALPVKVLRQSDIAKILDENRSFWRLTQSLTVNEFIEFLLNQSKLRKLEFRFPHRKETRYVWGKVPLYELVGSLKPKAYFSHYTAIYMHELTEQIPKTIYLNQEQTPKPTPIAEPTQESIDAAFRRAQRKTKNCTTYLDYRICVLNGKHTNQLSVIQSTAPDGATVRVTGLERTLIDITVRPEYAGGPFEVLKAYRLAKEKDISVNRLVATLKKLTYIYPYEQAVGFYLDRSGVYPKSVLRLLQKDDFKLDFYLTHQMRDTDYSERWRLFFPKGL